jgi:hypothetical protein
MRKNKLLLVFIFIATLCFGQVKKYIIPCTSLFISGCLDGVSETIDNHYSKFQLVFPKANPQFWNPAISWTNKYKNNNPADGRKFPGSEGTLVFLTDGHHAIRTAKNVINTVTLIYYIEKTNKGNNSIKRILLDAVILTIARNIGFYSTYNILFK